MDVLLPLLLFLMLPLLWLASRALASGPGQGPGQAGERRVGDMLAAHCAQVRNDIILPDDHGGLTQIDHLALVPAGVLVIETKTLSGQVFGRADEPTWTHCIGRRRVRMQNPLRQNFAHLQAVRALLPGAPVHGLVVFAGNARFPRGMPRGVCHLRDLPEALGSLTAGTVTLAMQQAWERLAPAIRTDAASRHAHLAQLRARHREPDRLSAAGTSVQHAGPLPLAGTTRIPALVAGFALGLVLVGGLAWLSLPGRPPDQSPGTAPLAVPAARAPAPVLTRPSPPPSADPGVPFPTAAPLPPVAGGTPLIERTGPARAASSEEL